MIDRNIESGRESKLRSSGGGSAGRDVEGMTLPEVLGSYSKETLVSFLLAILEAGFRTHRDEFDGAKRNLSRFDSSFHCSLHIHLRIR